MAQTHILTPYEGNDSDQYKQLFTSIKQKMNDVDQRQMKNPTTTQDMTHEDFLAYLECSQEDYIRAIQSSLSCPKIFMKRKVSELRMNPYIKELVRPCNANHDLQFVLDAYACAMYIVNYVSKSQKGMSCLMYNACKEEKKGNYNLREKVRHIGNMFLNTAEMSAQEAVYLALQLPLIRKSRDVIHLATCMSQDRTRLLKTDFCLKEIFAHNSKSTGIHASNVITHYAIRPKQLEMWCLADYASMLNVHYPKNDDNMIDPYPENLDDDPYSCSDQDNNDTGEEDDDHHVIAKFNNDARHKTANFLKINLVLRKGITIKSRQKQRVIKSVRYSEKVDPEMFAREQIMLYLPWRNETTDLLANYNSYTEHYPNIQHIIKSKQVEYDHIISCQQLDSAFEQAQGNKQPRRKW